MLGLRDVMDAPDRLKREWRSRNVLEKIEEYYDDIWVYGTPGFWDPMTGLEPRERCARRRRSRAF